LNIPKFIIVLIYRHLIIFLPHQISSDVALVGGGLLIMLFMLNASRIILGRNVLKRAGNEIVANCELTYIYKYTFIYIMKFNSLS
jgi:hypothetical protein